MSNATTTNQAVRFLVDDLKRLATDQATGKLDRAKYLNGLAQAAQSLAERHQKVNTRILTAQASFLETKKAEAEAHVDAELTALGDD